MNRGDLYLGVRSKGELDEPAGCKITENLTTAETTGNSESINRFQGVRLDPEEMGETEVLRKDTQGKIILAMM